MEHQVPRTTVRHRAATMARSGKLMVPIVAALALVVSGCSAGPAADPDSGYSQGVTDDTIKIGMLAPYSGNASVYSKAQRLAEMMYQEINDNGGINGRQIELVLGDDNCDAASMQGLIRKFVEQDHVFMIHGGSCSNAIIASKPLIEELGVPFLVVNAASAAISNPPVKNLFHPKPTAAEQVAAIAGFIASNDDAETVSVAATSDEWGQGFGVAAGDELTKLGFDIATTEELDPEGGDMTPAIRKLLNTNSDMAAVFAYPQPMTVFLGAAGPQGLNIPIVTGDGTRPDEQFERLGNRALVENFFSAYSYTAPIDDPKFDHYRELLKAGFSDLQFDSVALEGAVSTEFNIEVLKRMGDDLTWDNWIATAETGTYSTIASGDMSFQAFDASDPRTRRPGIQIRFAVLDPKATDGKTIVVDDWADWLSRQ